MSRKILSKFGAGLLCLGLAAPCVSAMGASDLFPKIIYFHGEYGFHDDEYGKEFEGRPFNKNSDPVNNKINKKSLPSYLRTGFYF